MDKHTVIERGRRAGSRHLMSDFKIELAYSKEFGKAVYRLRTDLFVWDPASRTFSADWSTIRDEIDKQRGLDFGIEGLGLVIGLLSVRSKLTEWLQLDHITLANGLPYLWHFKPKYIPSDVLQYFNLIIVDNTNEN